MSDQRHTPTQSEQRALARAKLARFIAAMFVEPDEDWFAQLRDAHIRAEIGAAASAIGISKSSLDPIFDTAQTDPDSYVRLLGHTVRSTCPPYELEYRTAEVFQQSQTLADIAGFYRAFGCDASGSLMERADHVASEWEFLSLLAWKESTAKRDDDVACCVDSQALFLEAHAAVWMPAFFLRIRQAGPGSFLAHLASLADLVLREWCETLNVSIGSAWLELRPITDEDSTITCGTPGAVELGPTLSAAMETGVDR